LTNTLTRNCISPFCFYLFYLFLFILFILFYFYFVYFIYKSYKGAMPAKLPEALVYKLSG
jgi:hypothetical protein